MKTIFIALLFALSVSCSDSGTGPEFPQDVVNDGYGDYLLVPMGEFEMGDNFNEGKSHDLPVHTVYLEGYYIGKYEVTNDEYKKFMEDGGYTTESYWSAGGYGSYESYGSQPQHWNYSLIRGGGIAGNEDFPVCVSWHEANAYCSWLSAKTGHTYRLPTEAEWEKAARGDASKNSASGRQRRYPWGDDIDGSYANYIGSGDPYKDNRLTPVGFYDGSIHSGFSTNDNASPYGAYDMAGNVFEWCSDWYDSTYYQTCLNSGTVTNPTGPGGYRKVIRGGSCEGSLYFLRSAKRLSCPPHRDLSFGAGIRCLREY